MHRRLFVPALLLFALAAAPAGAALTWKGHYRVHPGDSLTGIASDYGVSLAALAQANGLSPSSPLPIGALLRVPLPPAAAAPAWKGRYTVQVGDSLGVIASDHGISLTTLAQANGLDPSKPLLVGTILHVPQTTTPPTPAWKGRYTVQVGDSLGVIASDHGISLTTLAQANGLDPSKPLLVGTILHVPQTTTPPTPAWKGRYTVQVGDSLGVIASDHGISLTTLAQANGLDPSKPLLVGTVLDVPLAPQPTSVWRGSYVVASGDTLSSIALRYGVSLDALAAANHLDLSAVLPLGARLAVPAQAASTTLARLSESDPYSDGAIGYDTSYPGCAGIPPADDSFALIGLNAGRPFTPNPCFGREWAAATGPRSVYINTAYSPTLERHVTADCAAAGAGQPLGVGAQRAYAIGCSEADAALAQLGAAAPLAIWLDVEPANTWSGQPALNDATISGILEQLLAHDPHTLVGVYSKAVFWVKITGNWNAPEVPEWIATGAAGASTCEGAFAGGPVWLSQQANGLLDFDTAC